MGFNFNTGMRKLSHNGNRWKLVQESLTSFFDSETRLCEQEDVEDRKILSTVFKVLVLELATADHHSAIVVTI